MAYDEQEMRIRGNATDLVEFKEYGVEGKKLATFTVAVNYKKRDGEKRSTFFKVVVFDEWLIKRIGGIGKGSRVFVLGVPEADAWHDKKTGEIRKSIRVLATDVFFLPKIDFSDAPPL